MSAQVIPFVYNDKPVRSVMRGPDPWFVGKDVCAVLELRNHNDALSRLDDDERAGSVLPTQFGEKETIIISEAGVYRLVFSSRKAEAEVFKRWLAHEVLPQLRRTGRYALPEPVEPELMNEPYRAVEIRLAMIREARLLFGPARAAKLWEDLALPVIPQADSTPDSSARECLRVILEAAMGGNDLREVASVIANAAEDDARSAHALRSLGLRVEYEGDELWLFVANRSEWLHDLFEGTPWAHDEHRHALARLPGAKTCGPRKVGAQACRGVLLPGRFLDTALLQ